MPKLWSDTLETHRREVGDAILDTTAALASRHGLRAVTMSQIAEETGIGRATLYKYFPDVESILAAWHERLVRTHLAQLAALHAHHGSPLERLAAVLETFALLQHEHRGLDFAAMLHRGAHVHQAQQHLQQMLRELLAEGAEANDLRSDMPPDELATYCLHALLAASSLPSKAAVRRLVLVTLAGLHPGPPPPAGSTAPRGRSSRQTP